MAPDQVRFDESGNPVCVSPWIPVDSVIFEDLIKSTTLAHAMTGIPHVGRHVSLKVYPTDANADALRLGSEYIRRKWFARETLEDFIKQASFGQVAELPPVADR